MHGLSECIASFYVKRKIIPTEHKEIYSYGIELILNEALTFILVLITGAVLKNFIGSVIFLIVFCGTRIYTGGFHANTTAVCRMTMIITASSVIIFSRLIINLPCTVLITGIVFSGIILFPLIPVKHPNKNLTEEQKRKGKRRGILLYLIFSICSIFLWFFNKPTGILIALSLLSVTILAIIGTIKTKGVPTQ